MPETMRLAFVDDATLLSDRSAIREALEHEPDRKAELTRVYEALTTELDRRAAQVWAKHYEPPKQEELHRTPGTMSTWELIASYRHAWALAYYRPERRLAKALANWIFVTRRELDARGAWVPEIMPPQNM